MITNQLEQNRLFWFLDTIKTVIFWVFTHKLIELDYSLYYASIFDTLLLYHMHVRVCAQARTYSFVVVIGD